MIHGPCIIGLYTYDGHHLPRATLSHLPPADFPPPGKLADIVVLSGTARHPCVLYIPEVEFHVEEDYSIPVYPSNNERLFDITLVSAMRQWCDETMV